MLVYVVFVQQLRISESCQQIFGQLEDQRFRIGTGIQTG
jgi:hypothetical protein